MKHGFKHVFTLGYTPMLRAAALSLMSRTARMTSVARMTTSLGALKAVTPKGMVHALVQSDWVAGPPI